MKTPIKYRLAGRRRCGKVREIARKAYLKHDDKAEAIASAQAEVKQAFGNILVQLIMAVLLQLVVDLIIKWIKDNLMDPGAEYKPDEPGFIADE